ncbi:PIG-L deacetylase family protein [Thermogemmatispora onikobensis]|uniref:PIG-L deacetylase family protein n=1 Tax=Thermogemmatispora onikobensis TaxID=732234 RepID=UPI000852D172|nr:PIG-L family deacetylase [Thermogemmatispora onikobensis]
MQLQSIADIAKKHRHIFLSPHFDDVVFSCGGTIALQASCGLHPLVITVFAGLPPANQPLSTLATAVHQNMGFGHNAREAVEARRREDARALDYLGADYLWLDYPDAIYRGNPPHYTREEELFGAIHPTDLSIDQQLGQLLVSLSEQLPDTVWYAPLGVGHHVDHQLVCSAADRLVQRHANVKFYEDFPYVTRLGELERRLHEFGDTLEPAYVEMSELLPLRQEASQMYASQIAAIFGDKESMSKLMDEYTHNIRPVETVHLERYWTPRYR